MSGILIRTSDGLRWLLGHLVGLVLFAIVLLVCMQVFSRYFLGAPTPEMAELSRLLFIWLTFGGSALLISRRELIVIDLLRERLKAEHFKMLGLLTDAMTAVFLIALFIYARHLIAVIGHKIAPATGLPFAWFYDSILAFSGLGLFFIGARLASPWLAAADSASGKSQRPSIEEPLP